VSYCHRCGAQLADESATFCSKCGTQVSALASASGPAAPPFVTMPQQPAPKRGLGVGAIVGIVAAVIFVLAILAAIAIPTFLGQREKAQDASAKSLVRNAMIAIESGYVDTQTFDPAVLTPALLQELEPSVAWIAVAGNRAATDPTSLTADFAVDYFGTDTTYAVGTLSLSGRTFGVIVDKGPNDNNTFYVDGGARYW
jgi:type IV pilus assembly protein PilA